MTDSTRPENDARVPDESPEELGNTVDGSGAGESSADRAEQSKVYRTPEQPDHAVGGSDGTADGQ